MFETIIIVVIAYTVAIAVIIRLHKRKPIITYTSPRPIGKVKYLITDSAGYTMITEVQKTHPSIIIEVLGDMCIIHKDRYAKLLMYTNNEVAETTEVLKILFSLSDPTIPVKKAWPS